MLLCWNLTSRFNTVMYAVSAVVMAGAGALVAARHPRNPIGWLFCGFALFNALAADVAPGGGCARPPRAGPGSPLAEWLAIDELAAERVRLDPHVPALPGRAPAQPAVAAGAVARRGRARPGRARLVDEPGPGRRVRLRAQPAGGRGAADGCPAQRRDDAVPRRAGGVGRLARGPVPPRRGRRAAAAQVVRRRGRVRRCGPADHLRPLVRHPGHRRCWPSLALTALPLAACVAILRYRLYDIDVIVDRTVVYGTVTGLLAAAYGLTTVVLGTSARRAGPVGSPRRRRWSWRSRSGRCATGCRTSWTGASTAPATRRCGGWPTSSRPCAPGGPRPRRCRGVLRELTGDPRLRAAGLPAGEPALRRRERGTRSAIRRTSSASGSTSSAPAARSAGSCTAAPRGQNLVAAPEPHRGRRAGYRDRPAARRAAPAARRGAGVPGADRHRRRPRSGGGSSATSTTAPSSASCRSGSRCATPSISSAPSTVDHATRTLDEAVVEVAVAIDELRELARGLPPAQLDAGLAPAFRDLARRAPVPVEVTRAARAVRPRDRGGGLLHRVRRAHQRRQTRAGHQHLAQRRPRGRPPGRHRHRRRDRRRRAGRRAPGSAVWPTASPRWAASCGSTAGPAPAPH